ncbi:transcription factor [Ganoderma sinense ZZ0214-1]|uniref:Transcription factor n=1 Tax=Ganoderma sinense ZZ0214-1 TaxID=1077348 RepID=A0A2G8S678_9APHY|nr:transcription factor [Ganoderma sinense ZZ0214-1]
MFATSTWAMSPSAREHPSTNSPSTVSLSRARVQPHCAIKSQGGVVFQEDCSHYLLEGKQCRVLPVALPHAIVSADLSRAPFSTAPPITVQQRHASKNPDSGRYCELQDSWSRKSARQNLAPMCADTHLTASASSAAVTGRWAPSPPSLGPSTTWYGASDRKDTDPSDDDNLKRENRKIVPGHEGLTSPSFCGLFPNVPFMRHWLSQPSPTSSPPHCVHTLLSSQAVSTHPAHDHLRRDAIRPVSSPSTVGSPAPSSAESATVWDPILIMFRPNGTNDILSPLVSDVRLNISTQAEIPMMSSTHMKCRFVTNKSAEVHNAEENPDKRRPSGPKRTLEDASDSGPPRKRRQGQQLAEENSFPRGEGSGGRIGIGAVRSRSKFVRRPRGVVVPVYHCNTERALRCAFPGCGAVLTGKKSETASHMRSHFLQAISETLECPWPAEDGSERRRCGMAFKDSGNFGRHVSSKHIRAEEYRCDRCGRPFARRDAALRHMKTLCRADGVGMKKNEKTTKGRTKGYGEGEYST